MSGSPPDWGFPMRPPFSTEQRNNNTNNEDQQAGPSTSTSPTSMSLSQTVKGFQRQVSGHIQLAKGNPVIGPQVQRLVTGYEAWENQLRSEAQSRLENGFAPTHLITDGDWDLLKRVPRLPSSSMKKSASADSLSDSMAVTTTGPGSSRDTRGGSRLGSGSSRQGGGGGSGGGGFFGGGIDPFSASASSSHEGGYGGMESMFGPRLAPMHRGGPMQHHAAGYQPSDQQLLRLGIPRVPTAPSLQVRLGSG